MTPEESFMSSTTALYAEALLEVHPAVLLEHHRDSLLALEQSRFCIDFAIPTTMTKLKHSTRP
jgi:hypothetical protein